MAMADDVTKVKLTVGDCEIHIKKTGSNIEMTGKGEILSIIRALSEAAISVLGQSKNRFQFLSFSQRLTSYLIDGIEELETTKFPDNGEDEFKVVDARWSKK